MKQKGGMNKIIRYVYSVTGWLNRDPGSWLIRSGDRMHPRTIRDTTFRRRKKIVDWRTRHATKLLIMTRKKL